MKDKVTSTSTDLFPCPFCGWEKPLLHTEPDSELGDESYVRCLECETFGPHADTPKEAAAAWNDAQPSESTLKEIAEKIACWYGEFIDPDIRYKPRFEHDEPWYTYKRGADFIYGVLRDSLTTKENG